MKTFSIHSVRNLLVVVIALGLGYAAYVVNPSTVTPAKVQATSAENVSGYAWSDTIGWISFNDTTGGNPARPYGVNINTTTGEITGIAWSSGVDPAVGPQGFVEGGIGAISFNRADTGTPPFAPFNIPSGPIANVNLSTGAVTGWARALAVCTQDALGNLVPAQCAQNSNTGGWDGWIKLDDVTINLADGRFSGYAWGGADTTGPSGNSTPGGVSVIGWIKFAAQPSTDGCPATPNDYSGTTNCNYGVKGPVLTPLCFSNADCTGGKLCQISTGACLVAGGSCTSDLSCGSGQSCNGANTCVYQGGSCTANANCAGGQVCNLITSTCVAPTGGSCTGNADCVGGQICNTSTLKCVNKPKTKFWQF